MTGSRSGPTFYGKDYAAFIDEKLTTEPIPGGGVPAQYVNGQRIHGDSSFSRLLRRCRAGTREVIYASTLERNLQHVDLTLSDFEDWIEEQE